jgi:hypothetical protein
MGVVLVASAHLLPALCRSTPFAVRCVGCLLWLGCMAAASYGHATFFLLSQSHAGEVRGAAVPVTRVPVHRSLTAVMTERAVVTAGLAAADTRRCLRDCPALRIRRVSLAARLNALDVEAGEVRRLQSLEDGNAERRDATRSDPVTARLAILCGVTGSKLDLFAGLAFAAVLEGVSCLLWWIALLPRVQTAPVAAGNEAGVQVTPDPPLSARSVAEPETEVTKLLRDIAAGLVRPTVSGIRHHLACSQAKAASLRRQIVNSSV